MTASASSACNLRDGVVDPRRRSRARLLYRTQHHRRQRSHADRHPRPQQHHRRKIRRPIRSTDTRQRHCGISGSRNQRPCNQRYSRTVPIQQPARPARQQKHQHRPTASALPPRELAYSPAPGSGSTGGRTALHPSPHTGRTSGGSLRESSDSQTGSRASWETLEFFSTQTNAASSTNASDGCYRQRTWLPCVHSISA